MIEEWNAMPIWPDQIFYVYCLIIGLLTIYVTIKE